MRLYKALKIMSKMEQDLDLPEYITLRLFIRKVYNFLVFREVVIGFYGWDYDYSLQILRRALIEQYKELKDENIIEESELKDMLRTLKIAIANINRFLNITDSIEQETIKETGYVHTPIKFIGNVLHSFDTNEQKEAFRRYMKVRNKKEQDSWNGIWDTIKKNMNRWWS